MQINAEIVRSFTPIFLASVGGVIAIVVLLTPNASDTKTVSGLGVAGSAFAGASGLAQSGKNENKG